MVKSFDDKSHRRSIGTCFSTWKLKSRCFEEALMMTMLTLKKDQLDDKRLSATSTFNLENTQAGKSELNQRIYNALMKVGVTQDISDQESKRN